MARAAPEVRRSLGLVVLRERVPALGTLVEHRLTLIDRSQLHGVEVEPLVRALGALLIHHRPLLVTSLTAPNLLPSGFMGSMPYLNRNVSLVLKLSLMPLSNAARTFSHRLHPVHRATSPSTAIAAAAPDASSTLYSDPHLSQKDIVGRFVRMRQRWRQIKVPGRSEPLSSFVCARVGARRSASPRRPIGRGFFLGLRQSVL